MGNYAGIAAELDRLNAMIDSQRIVIESQRAELERCHYKLARWQQVGDYACLVLRWAVDPMAIEISAILTNLAQALADVEYKG